MADNILKVMSRDAGVLQGSMALYVNLMKSPNALSPARRELLATVVSNVNDCFNYINRIADSLGVDPEEGMSPSPEEWLRTKASDY